MKIGRYTIKLSERGKHCMEILGGLLCIAIMIFSLSAVAINIITADNDNLKVTHIYEDECVDLYNTKTEEYYFYCEDKTFYGKN